MYLTSYCLFSPSVSGNYIISFSLLLDVNTSNTCKQEINDLINKICNLKHINIDPNVLKTNKLRKKRKGK